MFTTVVYETTHILLTQSGSFINQIVWNWFSYETLSDLLTKIFPWMAFLSQVMSLTLKSEKKGYMIFFGFVWNFLFWNCWWDIWYDYFKYMQSLMSHSFIKLGKENDNFKFINKCWVLSLENKTRLFSGLSSVITHIFVALGDLCDADCGKFRYPFSVFCRWVNINLCYVPIVKRKALQEKWWL